MSEMTDATTALLAATSALALAQSQLGAWATGAATGGPNSDGLYPWTAADGAVVMIPSVAKIAAQLGAIVNPLPPTGTIPFKPVRGIFFDGDSITAGVGANGAPWSTQFAANTGLPFVNTAIPGQQFAYMDSSFNFAGEPGETFDPTVHDVLIAFAGTNDIGTGGRTDIQVQASATSYCAKVRAKGGRVVLGTILPRQHDGWTAQKESYRILFNKWLRANWQTICDGLIDFGALTAFQNPQAAIPAYFQEGLHPTNRGARLMAEAARLAFDLANIADDTPNAFILEDVSLAALSTVYTSNSVALVGFTAPAAISILGGSYSLNGATFTDKPGIVQPYDAVRVRLKSSPLPVAPLTARLSVGAAVEDFIVTTRPLPQSYALFVNPPRTGAWTYSNNNRTLTRVGTTDGSVRLDEPIVGKKCFAVEFGDGGDVAHAIMGLCDDATTTRAPGFDSHSFGAFNTGGAFKNAAYVGPANFGGWATPKVAMVVDADAKKVWWTADGISYFSGVAANISRAQVAAGVNGLDFSDMIPGNLIYACIGAAASGGRSFTYLEQYPYDIPDGFSILKPAL
jgi:lysophospholipase L1-like esterase